MRTNLPISLLLGVALLALGACGGGGDGPPSMTPMEPDTEMTYPVELPAGHGLTAGTIPVPADGIELASGTKISCANEEGDCQLTITERQVTGELIATSTGGRVTVTVKMAPIVPEPGDAEDTSDQQTDQDTAEADTELQEAERRAEEAERRAEEAERKAQEQLVANQRAERLLAAFPDATSDPTETSRVEISVPSPNKLTFKQSDYTVSAISAPSLRGARLTRTRGGTQMSVIYTDIELSRSLIKTYDPDAADDAEAIAAGDLTDLGSANFLSDADAFVITGHGFPTSKAADAPDPDPKTGTSFSGSLNGVSGKFECTGEDCMTLTPVYTEGRLTSLGASGVTTFKPASRTATVSLCDAPRSRCALTDTDYMAFGFWLSEPSNAQGAYQLELFAFGPDLTTTAPTVNAEFNGTAIGMYVEQNQVGAAEITKKQGEFIADARLDYDGTNLTGTIDGFKTTPTGGSGAPSTTGWVVTLDAAGATTLQRHGPDGEGTWKHRYTTDGSAVVGTFDSEVEEVLRISGAFGARRK